MLSNTAETNPSPNAVCHDGGGSCSTGISEADNTSASRTTVFLNAPGSSVQAGRRTGLATTIARNAARPTTGTRSGTAGKYTFAVTLAVIAAANVNSTMPSRGQSSGRACTASFTIGACAFCWNAAMRPHTTSAGSAATYACTTSSGDT